MIRTSLIRLGGLVAMADGVLYTSQNYLLWPLVRNLRDTELSLWGDYIMIGFTVLLALGAMVPIAAIAALHTLKTGGYGLRWLAALASVTAFVGVAITFVGVHDTSSMLFLIVGALVVIVGFVALGIATVAARVLPWWCGAALMVFPIFPALGPLGGVPWVVVGYALFRAGSRLPEQPSRVR
jgi:hypothetical protein